MNFDIQLNENHSFSAGDIFTNDQGVDFLIAFLYPPEVFESEDGSLTTIYRACCTLAGSTDCKIKLKFNQTSDNFKAISLVNNQFVLTTAENRSTYCGLIFPATKDESGNITSVVPEDSENPDVDYYSHRAYLLPLR